MRLWAIIDEVALRRPVGGVAVLRAQLQYLTEACQQERLTLQVTPFAAVGHSAPGAFSILRFADPDMPDMVYVENLASALYIDKPPEVGRYLLAMERLSIISAPPGDSAEILRTILTSLEGAL
jgi:hypothetical protein